MLEHRLESADARSGAVRVCDTHRLEEAAEFAASLGALRAAGCPRGQKCQAGPRRDREGADVPSGLDREPAAIGAIY
jgi:hypothetical protein